MDSKKALNKTMQICSRKEQCNSEIREKLVSWNVKSSSINEILNTLNSEKYIDEKRYAKSYVADKIKFNHWGRRKIEFLLKKKQIPENAISEALGKIDFDWYSEMIFEEIKKKLSLIKEDDNIKIKAKLFSFGNTRGYENELIFKAIDKLIKDN